MRILLATDGSEYSEAAARFLTCLRLTPEDEITVFHSVSWVPFLYDEESYYESLKQIKKEIAPRVLDAALKILQPVKARISAAIMDGSPEEYIVNIAGESAMDLIVMGARGVKGIQSMFVGSVTRLVAGRSTRPVFIVRAPRGGRKSGMKILFAADGSGHSTAAGAFLASLPFPEDTEVTVLNVIWSEYSDIPERFAPEVNDRLKELVADVRGIEFAQSGKILEQAGEDLKKRFDRVTFLSHTGDPSQEILKMAEEMGADVIAMGCRGLKGLEGMLGSVSRNIVNHAKCSVLIGKTCSL